MGFRMGASCGTALLVLAIRCAQPAGSIAQSESERIPEVRSTDEINVTSAGTTVKLKIDSQFRTKLQSVLKDSPSQTIRLTIREIAQPAKTDAHSAGVEGISVFLNKADATPFTSIDDPHYAGSAVFSEASDPGSTTLLFDLRSTIVRLRELENLSFDQPLEVTIVPYLSKGVTQAPAKFSMPVKSVSISLPRRKH